jgi:hypothetical protein
MLSSVSVRVPSSRPSRFATFAPLRAFVIRTSRPSRFATFASFRAFVIHTS